MKASVTPVDGSCRRRCVPRESIEFAASNPMRTRAKRVNSFRRCQSQNDRACNSAAACFTLGNQRLEHATYPVQVGDACLHNGEFLDREVVRLLAVLPIFQREQVLHFVERKTELLRALDKANT